MKVLHICAVGFTVKHLLLPQINYLLSQNLSVEVACSAGLEVDNLRTQGYIIHPIQIDRRLAPFSNIKSIYHLTKLMVERQYDLVHVHTPIAAVLGRIAAKLAGVKRIVYTAHGFPFYERSSPSQYRFYFAVEKFSALLTDLILSQSYEDVITAQNFGLCSPEKVRHLSNGVDINHFKRTRINPTAKAELKASLGIANTANLLIGTIGRLTRKKGSGYLIQAAASLLPEFPNLHILVIGGQLSTDPEQFQTELVKLIHNLGIEKHVTLTGYRNDTPELLGLLDIFTLPTFTHEGLPRSILEAMSMGLPIVTTDIRGCREAVVHGKTGLIVPPEDQDKLIEALRILLSNPELRQSYGKASRELIESKYDERMVFERLQFAYQDLGVWKK
ncbi:MULTISPECIES: glycosyltransferase family 4 protein [Cyanophyceae]|uniref:glycosyltransferase family 4 protein n=1 Tax=Cyanophyceae TaxID=3028117 RepID=UPI001687D672|nr:glycosyltransferase family 4 protein [Trichocoleus sp. FACHB-40]MBD2002396.1 glycosyltransferase family 4 protein [Trichocoleus sp. FACHB-40]